MKQKLVRRLLCLLLVAVMLPGLMPAAQAEETDLTKTVEKQIRAYADSIDQSNAVETAAAALAIHGISMGGKKMSIGENSALTAVLMNSEFLQLALRDTCIAAIDYMHTLNLDSLPTIRGWATWSDTTYFYDLFAYLVDKSGYDNRDQLLASKKNYTGNLNSYDRALEWMSGITALKLNITPKKVTEDTATYEVSCTMLDRFDFDTSTSAGFKKWISGIGALLFEEFDWEAKVTFELTVPYSCNHSYQSYHWTYDAEDKQMNHDPSAGFAGNEATRYEYTSGEKVSYYYKLQETVRLMHNKPWVLEYQVRNPGYFVFAPLKTTTNQQFYLDNRSRAYLLIRKTENVVSDGDQDEELGDTSEKKQRVHSYGTAMGSLFSYSNKRTYTIRLENQIQQDGGNIINLTVYDENREILLNVPMDDYYLIESRGEDMVLKETDSDGISGQDIMIRFLGNRTTRFSADYFDLRIWENGEDTLSESAFSSKVTKPTCTEDGYTTYTCALCGYSYNGDYIAANGHDFGAWYTLKEATCTETGEEGRACAHCDAFETRETPALGHDNAQIVTPPTCTEQGYTTYICNRCGDSYEGAYVDASGHDYHGEVTHPACIEEGYTTYTCAACGDRYISDHTAPLGHSYGDWTVLQEATEEAEGLMMRACTRCDHAEEQTIPKRINPFDDVKAGVYYYDPVLWAVENGVTAGTDATHFSPDDRCTRAQVVTFLWRAMGCPEPSLTEHPFVDVKEGSFYYKAVLWALENGITAGTDATHFGPDNRCTRAQVVTFLWRAMGCPEPSLTEHPFVDVKEGSFYYKAVLWALENGITAGTDANHFGPEAACTRGQVATFLWRTMGKPEPVSAEHPFRDLKEGAFYYEPVLWALENGITAGTGANTFAPDLPCTRGQIVSFLYRTLAK